ncbi:MAG: AarF/ABC1/UbiB kinase family protein [Rubripirellula sp.]|nr:ABC transporter [Rhodopirellula sp.]MCH1441522.1 AarF/ABC1/UbiB kinase family protein [Rubripirellula sp.]OUX07251.1 MAG: ABC transporter [Planctomycetaceae bacterium TMED240]
MEVTDLPRLVRNTARFHEVVSVAMKYGIAPWLSGIRTEWVQRHLRTTDGQQISELPEAVRVRMALTELGTTFIKLGQILSTRSDLIGPDLAAELSKLQSSTPPDPIDQVHLLIMEELGGAPDQVFQEFESVPFASASIGQVHHAVLKDGKSVVVKVQHADIEERVRNDLEILIQLAELAEHYSQDIARYRPLATAREFARTLRDELDFTREQSNLLRFKRNFRDNPMIAIPACYPQCCSRRVLTMDCLNGIELSDRTALQASDFDLAEIAKRGANMFLQMIFRDGFYHADPHPGNLMVLQNSVIGLLDCGMVGRVDEELREHIEDLLMAAIDRDSKRLQECVVELGEVPTDFDRTMLQDDLVNFVEDYGGQSIDQFDLSGSLNGMIEIVRKHHILLPSKVSLLIKMLIMLEGTAHQLSPNFNLIELLEPYRVESVKRRLSPQRAWKKLQSAQRDWTRLAETLPSDVADIMNRIRRGSFDINLEHRKLDSITNRLVLGILTAALFVGSASLWSNAVPPQIGDVSLPGSIGCGVAIYLGFTLVRAIKKSGNLR